MPRLTPKQLAERALGLGATDVSTAAGVNPWQTPFELYLSKIGELDVEATISDASRDRMERGHRLEDVALEWDRDITGDAFERVNRTIWHPKLSFIYCHPDARRKPWRETKRLVEVKTSNRRWKEVPRHVVAQVQVQMACTGATSVDIVVLGFDGPPERFVVDRDPDLIDALEQVAVAFWDRVQRKDPPPIDGSEGAGRWLDKTSWRDEPEMIANQVQRNLVSSLVATRARIDQLEAQEDQLVNQIKQSMAGAGRLNVPRVARIVWTAPTVTKRTQWKEVAVAFRQSLLEMNAVAPNAAAVVIPHVTATFAGDLDVIEALYQSERESRTFRVTLDEGEESGS